MKGLLFQPSVERPASIEEAVTVLSRAGVARRLTAEVVDGECRPISASGDDEPMPLGSVFKLYVLGAVVDAVNAGTISWDQSVAIRDELDALPSGTTQDEPAGTELTVRELAERMISISDNTATDHLIDLVGRDTVEAAQQAYGHSTPALNEPFLTTRELFILKFGDAGLRNRFVAADEGGRRQLLSTDVAAASLPSLADVVAVTEPVEITTLEWFASPLDVCRALVALDASPQARAILSINPGVPAEGVEWERIAFKGGSEPGVLAVAWLTATADDRRFVMAGGVANEDAALDETTVVTAFAALRDLIQQ
jgi:hypothetical protein